MTVVHIVQGSSRDCRSGDAQRQKNGRTKEGMHGLSGFSKRLNRGNECLIRSGDGAKRG